MEESKEGFTKPSSDAYSDKNASVSRASFIKNNTHLSLRPETGRKKLSYISRAKHVSMPVDKKYGFYRSDANSFMNHSCDKCGVKTRPHYVVNTAAAASLTEVPKFDSGHDFNGNVSFSTRSSLCNFATSVSEISSFNQVLSFQSTPHYDLSIPKSINHKQRTVYSENRAYSPKVTNPQNSFSANRFFSIPSSSIRCHCSKTYPQKFTPTEPYLKFSDRTSRENIAISEKYSRYVKYATLPDTLTKSNSVKINDLPIFETSNFPKDSSMSCKVDFSEEKLKQRNYTSRKWNPAPLFGESSKSANETDKMLFPALSSNHNQQGKSNPSSLISPEKASVENFTLENAHLSEKNCGVLIVSTSGTTAIPQASYADVIRMSVTCSGTQENTALDYEKTAISEHNQSSLSLASSVEDKQPKDDNPQPGSSDWVISRLSQVDLNVPENASSVTSASSNQNEQNFIASRPVVVSLEKPSFYKSSLQSYKNAATAISSSAKTLLDKTIENESIAVDCLSNIDTVSVDNSSLGSANRSSVSSDFTSSMTDAQSASIKTDSVYSSPSSVSSLGDAFKPIDNRDIIIDNILNKVVPPVIIMNDFSPNSMTEISFGIEYDEMLKLCSDSCSHEDNIPLIEENVKDTLSEKTIQTNSLHSTTLKLPESISIPSKSETEISNHSIISINGKNLCWKDSENDYNVSNHMQLTEYFAGEWEGIQRDYIKGSSQVNRSVRYFNEL